MYRLHPRNGVISQNVSDKGQDKCVWWEECFCRVSRTAEKSAKLPKTGSHSGESDGNSGRVIQAVEVSVMGAKHDRIQKLRHCLEDLRWDEMQILAARFGGLTAKRDKPVGAMNTRWATYRPEETAFDLMEAVSLAEAEFAESDAPDD